MVYQIFFRIFIPVLIVVLSLIAMYYFGVFARLSRLRRRPANQTGQQGQGQEGQQQDGEQEPRRRRNRIRDWRDRLREI